MLATFGVVLVLIASAAAMFVGSYSGQRVAGLATRVQHLERALGAAELSRVYVIQAAYLANEANAGDTLTATIDAALDSLSDTVTGIEAYLSLASAENALLQAAVAEYAAAIERAIELVAASRTSSVTTFLADDLQPVYVDLTQTVLGLQRSDAAEINQTSSTLGRIADVVRFLLAFALPAVGMTVYRWVMNRQRRHAEMRLKLEAEQAINKSKDEFIANVSHELRTPLTGIIGFAQLLEDSDLDPRELDVIRLIVDQSAELSRMVDDLLTAARADANALTINLRPVSIQNEVAEVIRFTELMRIDVEVSCQVATVMIDPERFRQVLRNLLVNARKHGGSHIRVRGVVKDDSYVCSVIDNGPGVPAHVQERLFSRFVHTGESPVIMGSVGLGLAIVSELCRLMGCEVSYRRVRGETWFSVTMPRAASSAPDRKLALVASA